MQPSSPNWRKHRRNFLPAGGDDLARRSRYGRLAIEIARRVLHRELSVDPSALEALIKAALEKLQAQEIYRVRVHPDQEKCSALPRADRPKPAIEVIGDPVQPKGGASLKSAAARWTLPSIPSCARSNAA